ncbi:MAG: sigma-70 family RNA polymerase sigma factor [Chitinophagaceae bacterium]|nr:MAG: sigma-70 family RNA polymerase sigma factor [Chitinophagaceae bacterium]
MENKDRQFKDWVEQYSDDLFRWAYYKVSSKEAAEDLVQETFMAAYRSWDKFNHDSSPKTWLHGILKNKLMDYFRKKARDIVISESMFDEHDADSFFDAFFDENGTWKKEASPQSWETEGELLDNTDFRNVLFDCLKKLPPAWYHVVNLKYLEEKNSNDICQEVNISPTNFWQILYRARLQLRACVENNWFKK